MKIGQVKIRVENKGKNFGSTKKQYTWQFTIQRPDVNGSELNKCFALLSASNDLSDSDSMFT